MNLESLGYSKALENYKQENNLDSFEVGRVIVEHKERYLVRLATQEIDAEITGNLRFSAQERADFPAVGDWVALSVFDDSLAIIHHIFPRHSALKRQAVGKFGEQQIIATNIDYAFIVQGVDNDFNVNRLERYLTVCKAGNVSPIILLSKIDLIKEDELNLKIEAIRKRHESLPIYAFSNLSKTGFEQIKALLQKSKTYCIIGSSGVGKSTLINNFTELDAMKTSAISSSTNKGRHTTSHRELILLENGAMLIDTPGMREIGVIENVEDTFDEITAFGNQCRFKNCTHLHEDGCAVLEAVENGQIDPDAYQNFLKMQREANYFQTSVLDKRKREKSFGKMMKRVVKHRKKNKF